MTPGALLLLAAASLTAGIVSGPRFARIWLALTLAGTAAALGAALLVLTGSADWERRSGFLVGGEALHFRLDGVSALFLVLVSVVGGLGAVYAREYWSDEHYPTSAPRSRAWWCALVLSMGLVLLCSNGLHFLIAWELFAITAFFLITLDRQRREVRAAGWLYLAASHAGTVCLFAFFGMLAARTGSWDLGPMREQVALTPLFWLALAGFGVKAGLFPLHIWLPSAHANAPSHVSAIMSGVAIKMGIYGLVRFSGWLPVPVAAGWVVIGLGAVSALFGIAFGLAQNDLKRLLAYCSVENIGIILIGLGTAVLGMARGSTLWGRLALAGALLHVWNHGAFKSLLFFGAGSIMHGTGTREMSRLGGLWRVMPWTASLFAIGVLAVSGLPPLNGFVSEWLVYLGLFDAATHRGAAVWAFVPAAIMLAMAGALALACFVKAGAVVFLGAPRTQAAEQAHESGPLMRGPMLALAGGCLAIGLAPVLFWPAISRAVGDWNPAWVGGEPPAPLMTLGSIQIVLALIGCGASVWLWWKARANGLRRSLTWDCGFAAPTARMQYTSGSFAGLASGWFVWLLQPERQLRRPRGPLPVTASRVERVPETVLERLLTPAGDAIMVVSAATRRLQHGRLQAYILYVVAGLVAVGLLVLLGGSVMTIILDLIVRLAVWVLIAPLLPGIINKVKAWVAGRRGPPVLQLYYDLVRLWQKSVVLSTLASPGFVFGPAIAWVAVAGAALLLPVGPAGGTVSFRGDMLVLIYLLALARFCTAWAALETGSAFEGMGAVREVSYAVLAEAAIIAALLALCIQTGSAALITMLSPAAGPGAVLLAAGLFMVLLAENCRVPFDDPNTHLELTMIHEVMVLDHSGPPLAVVLHGASVKLLLFALLLTEAVLPVGQLTPLAATGVLIGGVLVVTVGVGLVESLLARFAFRRVPLLLTTAFLLCLFALLMAWKGGPA